MDNRLKFNGIGHFYFAVAKDAQHRLGDFSQGENLCLIYGETSSHWIGRWLVFEHETYRYFYDVMFPKNTTTIVNNSIISMYDKVINSSWVKEKMIQHNSDLAI